MKMALKNDSVDLVPGVSWYYEEPSHIEIVHWVTERDGYKKAHHIRIPWRKLQSSVERKYGGPARRGGMTKLKRAVVKELFQRNGK